MDRTGVIGRIALTPAPPVLVSPAGFFAVFCFAAVSSADKTPRGVLSRLLFKPDYALVVPAAMSTSMATTTISGEGVFTPRFVASVAYVASTIARLVSLEVVEALRPALGQRPNVADEDLTAER